MADPWAAAGFSDTPPPAPPPVAPKVEADPWAAAGFSDTPPPKTAAGKQETFTEALLNTWPARLAKAAWSGFTLPYDVVEGTVKPGSDEEIRRAADLAMIANPASAASGTTKAIAQFAPRRPSMFSREYEAAPAGGWPGAGKSAESLSSGQQAAQTAQALRKPLPAGLASDRPGIQNLTRKAEQVPFSGQIISKRASETVKAAGAKVEDIAGELAPSTGRSATDAATRRGLQDIVDANTDRIDSAYDNLRSAIDPDKSFDLPKTRAALEYVGRKKVAAGKSATEGLEQAWNVVNNKGSFNGLQDLRQDITNAGKPGVVHPGYNAGQFRFIRKAITADMRNVVRQAGDNPNTAESLFNSAEITAKQHINENKYLEGLLKATGEGAGSSVLGAPREQKGNLELLAKMRRDMKPDDFSQVTGTYIRELGTTTNGFSLNKFSNEWLNKTSEGAKNVMFSPEHRKWLDNIAQLGQHVKGSDKYANYSNSSGGIILFDIIKSAVEGAIAIGAGVMNPTAGLSAVAGFGAAHLGAKYLARPATAAAMSAWTTAYRAATLGVPSSARIAQLKIATQNLANNLGISPDQTWNIVVANAPKGDSSPAQSRPTRTPMNRLPAPQGQEKDQSRMAPAGTR